ncbi:MAG: hypothetical protein IJ830_03010 [Alphaproteobacteria bacterium]|nr:hypothetical protein [Alphaproteobacteria bacterium]
MWILFTTSVLPNEHGKPLLAEMKLLAVEAVIVYFKPFLLGYIALAISIVCFIVMIAYLCKLSKKNKQSK